MRPTSETVIGEYFAKWIQSYRDLPLLVNQWSNVVRWELRPRLFLRTSEFLWQEGHTCHVDEQDARAFAIRVLREAYEDFMVNVLAIPVQTGNKTAAERFAGATNTMTCEALMRDGKALQMGTSHELGQNFARAFEIDFLSADGERELVWQTSWGTSTRMVGGLIMTHGDDRGLRVPPRLAPIQVVVIVVRDDADTKARAAALVDELNDRGVRARLDDRVDTSFGRRATDWELKGVPVRFELGPRDLGEGVVTMARRTEADKQTVPLDGAANAAEAALVEIQQALFEEAVTRRDAVTTDVDSLDDAIEAAGAGFARVPWAKVGVDGEERAAADGVTVRCLQAPDGGLPTAEDEAVAYLARAY